MPSARDDDPGKKPTKAVEALRREQREEASDDLEFSDLGRDPRYPPAWWILPILVVVGIIAAVLIGRFIL